MGVELVVDSKAHDGITRKIKVYISDDLEKKLKKYKQQFEKFMKAISKYGYVGNSLGEKNGIVKIKSHDYNLQERIFNFINSRHGANLINQYSLKMPVEGVKVVAHCKSGDRLIGLKDNDNKMLLFEMRNYKK